MSAVVRSAVRPGAYFDSVVLMQLQRALAALPGVLDAGVVMATAANLEILAANGLAAQSETSAGPHDLLIAVRAETAEAAAEALAGVDALLQVRRSGAGEDFRPRSLASALKSHPETGWVLVSVPGRHAAGVAEEALDQGRNVFLYSDNVPLAEEVALKSKARERGLLVMGPDCGTAVIGGGGAMPTAGGGALSRAAGEGWGGGAGLGFANRVRRGAIGLIGASGTGLQAVMSRIHALGAGITHAIGTGGRDLCRDVGGITALQALDLLRRDPETRVLVLIAKPPDPEVALRLLALAREAGKPAVVHFLGAPLPGRRLGNLRFAASLSEAAELAVQGLAETAEAMETTAPPLPEGRRFLRGLFSGGTLAYETLLALSAVLAPVYSNAPLHASQRLPDPLRSRAHTVLDLGADEFTVGRLHPMIDPDLRLRRLRQEAADPEVGVILLDLVLGDGAHADPAGELAPAIAAALAAGTPEIAVVVIGTDADPQDLDLQIQALERAGARVCRDVEELVDYAVRRLPSPALAMAGAPVPLAALQAPLAAINVGLESFCDSLLAQGAAAVQVEWRPPAGGDERLAGILARMKGR